MHYNLRGKILNIKPFTIDPNLTLAGAAAEAKATGEAISKALNTAKEYTNTHANNKENPHGVTKTQVGLGNVDNTSDMNKPVSTAQASAIADAKKAGTEAMTEAQKKTEKIEKNVTLLASGWTDNTQTVEVEGVTSENSVIVCTNPANATEYTESVVRCSDQNENSLTFTCDEVPAIDLLVNVLILI